jgi:hypothetical protein
MVEDSGTDRFVLHAGRPPDHLVKALLYRQAAANRTSHSKYRLHARNTYRLCCSVADPGCLSRIRVKKIPDPHLRIEAFLAQKLFPGSRKYDPDVHPGFWIRIYFHPGSRA